MAGKKGMRSYPVKTRVKAVKYFLRKVIERKIFCGIKHQKDTQLEYWFGVFELTDMMA